MRTKSFASSSAARMTILSYAGCNVDDGSCEEKGTVFDKITTG